MFQWSNDEEEGSDYVSSSTVSSIRTRSASVNMADCNDDLRRRMDAQEQATKAQQEALNNIQLLLG
jgi:hypothetical protein